jgi:hypothetical protein
MALLTSCMRLPPTLYEEQNVMAAHVPAFGLVRLAGCQPASSAFFSHQFSTSHQSSASQ